MGRVRLMAKNPGTLHRWTASGFRSPPKRSRTTSKRRSRSDSCQFQSQMDSPSCNFRSLTVVHGHSSSNLRSCGCPSCTRGLGGGEAILVENIEVENWILDSRSSCGSGSGRERPHETGVVTGSRNSQWPLATLAPCNQVLGVVTNRRCGSTCFRSGISSDQQTLLGLRRSQSIFADARVGGPSRRNHSDVLDRSIRNGIGCVIWSIEKKPCVGVDRCPCSDDGWGPSETILRNSRNRPRKRPRRALCIGHLHEHRSIDTTSRIIQELRAIRSANRCDDMDALNSKFLRRHKCGGRLSSASEATLGVLGNGAAAATRASLGGFSRKQDFSAACECPRSCRRPLVVVHAEPGRGIGCSVVSSR